MTVYLQHVTGVEFDLVSVHDYTFEPTSVYSHWIVSAWPMTPFIPSTYSMICPRAESAGRGKEKQKVRETEQIYLEDSAPRKTKNMDWQLCVARGSFGSSSK